MSKELMKIEFTDDQVKLIKTQIAKDCSDDELKLFLYQCKRTGLDPLTRQIYAIKRAGRMTIQCSIDGFRVIAERSGSYAGQDEPVWEDENGHPVKCSVSVYKFSPQGQRYCAAVGVAHFKEYYPNPINLQKTMPHVMIAKVAEALALRKAFPQDLSGLYTGDEMNQAETFNGNQEEINDVPTEDERKILRGLVYNSDLNPEEQEQVLESIELLQTYKKFQYIQHELENRQLPIDQITNPNQRDINSHLRKTVKA